MSARRRHPAWAWAAAIAALSCGHEGPARRIPTLLLAIDGLEPTLVDRLIGEGKLPHLARLIERGSRARIAAEEPLLSPVIWTTIATGVGPERHGIHAWTVDDRPIASVDRLAPAFWNLFARAGRPAATIGWLATWPVEAEAGIIVSDRAVLPQERATVLPPDAIDLAPLRGAPPPREAAAVFSSYPYDPDYAHDEPAAADRGSLLLDHALLRVFYRDLLFARAAEQLLARGGLDLAAVYLRGTDDVGHGFWQFLDPQPFAAAGQPVDPRLRETLATVIPRYYAFVDGYVGSLQRALGGDANVVLLSDHGMGDDLPPHELESPDAPYLSGNHRALAELVVSGPAFARGAEATRPVRHVDILPTLLYLADLPLSRELEGRVLAELLAPEAKVVPPRIVDAYEPLARSAESGRGAGDREILERLRALGYVQ